MSEGAYLETRSMDPMLEAANARMAAARAAGYERRVKEAEPGLIGQTVQSLFDFEHLVPNVAIAAYDAVKNTANLAMAAGGKAVNMAERAVETTNKPSEEPFGAVSLESTFPEFMKAADGVRNELAQNSTTMDVVLQKGLQFMVPFTGALRATKFAEAGGLIEKAAKFVAADVATNYSVWDPHEGRFGDLLRQLAPDNRLIARFTDLVAAKPGESVAEGRWKNALDSLQTQAVLTPLIAAAAGLIRGGAKAMATKLKPKVPRAKDLTPAAGASGA